MMTFVSLLAATAALAAADFSVDANVPAGNIAVDGIAGDTVRLHQEQRDTINETWFYWGFRVTGAAGRTLRFVFTDKGAGGGPVGVRGPVVSTDGGKTFSYPLDGKSKVDGFTYAFPKDAREVRFYETFPYVRADWDSFLARLNAEQRKSVETGVWCVSRRGASVPFARVGRLDGKPRHRFLVTARHHCSETTASFVVEGLVASFLADDDLGGWLRGNVELTVVPFIDYDGAQAGDQGKRRAPHDHNRDYTEFIYPETRAVRDFVTRDPRFDILFDIHCPWIRHGCNEYLYTPWKDPKLVPDAAAETRFSQLLEKLQCGSMRYRARDDMPFGVSWNTAKNYAGGLSSIQWLCLHAKEAKICRTFEVPFANANGAVVTPDTCRDLGRDLAKVCRELLASAQ